MSLRKPLPELFTRSKLMTLDFSQILSGAPEAENIEAFFRDCEAKGVNPRLPQNRQQFNNRMLGATGTRYLVSRYGEDRSAMLTGSQIAAEGRNLHMGIDIFSRDLPTLGRIEAGEPIATLGDYHDNENGGWSRHLHLQIITALPPEGETPIGYSTKETFNENSHRFPDPMQFFPQWQLAKNS